MTNFCVSGSDLYVFLCHSSMYLCPFRVRLCRFELPLCQFHIRVRDFGRENCHFGVLFSKFRCQNWYFQVQLGEYGTRICCSRVHLWEHSVHLFYCWLHLSPFQVHVNEFETEIDHLESTWNNLDKPLVTYDISPVTLVSRLFMKAVTASRRLSVDKRLDQFCVFGSLLGESPSTASGPKCFTKPKSQIHITYVWS